MKLEVIVDSLDINFFVFVLWQAHFHVRSLNDNEEEISSAIYLQVSIISQALNFVTRSQSWSFMERIGTLLLCAFVGAQMVRFLVRI